MRFMRFLCLILVSASLGCGVSKELYQQQVLGGQELQARNADLQTRLKAEADRREAADRELDRTKVQLADTRNDLERCEARVQESGRRIDESSRRENDLMADLDLSRRTTAAKEAELDHCRQESEDARRRWEEDKARLEGLVEDARSEVADLRSRIAILVEEKERTEREKREKLDELSRTYEGLLEGMRDEVEKGRVTISQLRGQLTVNLLDEILFDSGSSVVKPEGRALLKQLVELLVGIPDKAIVIEGHTDAIPISGELAKRYPSNWELSTARATSVVRYLQDVGQLDPGRLAAVGYGQHHPVAPNDTPENRSRNRRIEIKLLPLESPLATPASAVEEGVDQPAEDGPAAETPAPQ